MASARRARPQFRNVQITQILSYRLPPAAVVSILHRISGALLFLLLPFILYLLELSLSSEASFARLQATASHWLVRIVLVALTWALLHHLVAGLRYLALDLHLGVDKEQARRSALAVFAISLPLALLAALKIFGVL
ncbi:MAG: succinate dehydrogenase, cytochrome b556 subunit [Burkholderiaceae bacterium]|nr:succinate dehydrogenase, cytochrome b556 subunit [Burkholderiaceae bacterium]